MKIAGIIMMLLGTIVCGAMIFGYIIADNQYNREIYSNWSLADKSSTIEAKSDYINKFVSAIEKSGMSGHDALFLRNPDNSFEQNFNALKTLQERLEQMKTMDPASFEYQQAISQITAQEQGEAQSMLGVFSGIWYLNNHILLWSWIGGLIVTLFSIIAFLGLIFILTDF